MKLFIKTQSFYSLVVFTPQVGKRKVINYLSNAVNVFKIRVLVIKKLLQIKTLL